LDEPATASGYFAGRGFHMPATAFLDQRQEVT
jgi:hypothetical protein